MSDRIAVFNDGVIQQLATPDDLYERPQNSFVAQFIGENNKIARQDRRRERHRLPGRGRRGPAMSRRWRSRSTAWATPRRCRCGRNACGVNPATGHAAQHLFRGQVEELIYLGDHTRVRASVCGNNDFVIKVPNSEGVPTLAPGAAISVGWKKEDCRALDAF